MSLPTAAEHAQKVIDLDSSGLPNQAFTDLFIVLRKFHTETDRVIEFRVTERDGQGVAKASAWFEGDKCVGKFPADVARYVIASFVPVK